MNRLPFLRRPAQSVFFLGLVLLLSAANSLRANLPVHGSLSVTASYSDEFNYLGETRDSLDLNLVDIILNSTHRFSNGLRIGAQVYAYQIGDYEDLTIDFANADYSFNEYFGVRAGRNKLPLGLYNDSQDIDSIRTFASLPIAFYPRTFRAITNSFDGLSLYGNIGLGKAGTLEYQIYGGYKEDIEADAPVIRGLNDLSVRQGWDIEDPVYGAHFIWNPPVDGLKLGYAYLRSPKNSIPATLSTKADMISPSFILLANQVDASLASMLGPNAWDKSGLFAGTPANATGLDLYFRTLSVEYTKDKWVLAAEYKMMDIVGVATLIPALQSLPPPVNAFANTVRDLRYEFYYGMVSYQATDKLGLGFYYSHTTDDRNNGQGLRSSPTASSDDYCAAVSYALNDWCVVKAEVHQFDGRNLINTAGDNNRQSSATETKWNYLVLKTTLSF